MDTYIYRILFWLVMAVIIIISGKNFYKKQTDKIQKVGVVIISTVLVIAVLVIAWMTYEQRI